jgi:cellobiose phosphorylase
MRYGHFDDDAQEYVITQPDTPLPWINYLGSENYFALISNTAGGYSFFQDARLRRITRYRYNNVPLDYGGRYLYIRDNQSDEYWAPTWQPVRQTLEDYQCRHGMGYTIIQSSTHQIKSSIRYFVPLGGNLELWDLTITNHRAEDAQLGLFSLVEFALWDALDDATNFQRNFNVGEVEIHGSAIYHKTEYRERRNHFAYFACSEPLAGYDTQRDTFLGPYRGWDEPAVVVNGQSNNSTAHGWAPIGSHHIELSLPPGETKRVIFILGYHENPSEHKFISTSEQQIDRRPVESLIAEYLDPKRVDQVFSELKDYWQNTLEVLQVNTPDVHTNRMVNIWNAYQCMVTYNLSRSASYFESGVGRGMGFRDSNQDLLGFVHMAPKRAHQRILDLAATQLENGGAYHQYQPLTKRGNDAVGSNFNDDPLWLVLAVSAYLKESGDWSILEELVPYENLPGSDQPLYDHLQRSIRYTLDRLGPHGLPLIGRADWNDCLNLNTFSEQPGESFQTTSNKDGLTAESVFIAGLFVLAAREMSAIAGQLGRQAEAIDYQTAVEQLTETTLEYGWDGAWFLRAYDDNGDRVGSQSCQEGQIFIEPQGICAMAGIGEDTGQAKFALEAVTDRLATQHGILLHQPAYSRYYLHLGEISTYPPGYKENAGVFCHTNPWIMIAAAKLGDGDMAFDYYTRINPSNREAISDVHRCEPYVYAQMIAGRDAATFGEAKNSWLTGTAAWNYFAITQWILGIRPDYEGLVIDPRIPIAWEGFTAERRFRGVQYHIQVERVGPGSKLTLFVNGEKLPKNLIPLPTDRQTVQVVAQIGHLPLA